MPPKPRVQIPVHVFVWTIAFIPTGAYAYYWYKNAPTEEEFEETLRKNYSQNIVSSQEKRTNMTAFLQNMKDPNSEHTRKMDQVLLGGRGQQKRLYSVDEKIYGTEEGAKLQMEAQQKAAKKKKKKRRKKKKSEGNATTHLVGEGNVDENVLATGVKQSMAAVAVVGALAAGASLFLSGKRS